MTLADVARMAHLDPPPMTYANATHACIVAIDADTGALLIERYVVARARLAGDRGYRVQSPEPPDAGRHQGHVRGRRDGRDRRTGKRGR